MQSLLGILLIIGCVFGGYMIHGGEMHVIWQPTELLIIVGAGVGAAGAAALHRLDVEADHGCARRASSMTTRWRSSSTSVKPPRSASHSVRVRRTSTIGSEISS